jgi:hypothetical protein
MDYIITAKEQDKHFEESLNSRLEASYQELLHAASELSGCQVSEREKLELELAKAAERFTIAHGAAIALCPMANYTCPDCGSFLGLITNGSVIQCHNCFCMDEVHMETESEQLQ